MIAGKMMDPVLGIDIHIIQPPGPVPPIPIPHPFIGMVVDPMDLVPFIGATVMVNGMPRATAGTGCKNLPPHIPIGGTFIKPPGNEGEIFMGSSTVLSDGSPQSFMGVPVLSCSDIGMPAPPRPKKKGGAKSLMLPTSVLMAIPAGGMVMIGGPPTIDMMAMAMKLGMAGLGKAFKKIKASKMMKGASKKIHGAAKKAMTKLGVPPNIQNKVHKGICSVTGHPVDISSGKVFTERTDFELPGPIPLKWERIWYSSSSYNGPLGYGWHHNYDLALVLDRANQVVALRMPDGRSVPFEIIGIGESAFNRQERLSLYRDIHGYYVKDSKDQLYYRFKTPKDDPEAVRPLERIENKAGFSIKFDYTLQGHLRQITDSAGRTLTVLCNAKGQITDIHAPHPEKIGETFPIIRYDYDEFDNMVNAWDALDQLFQYQYDYHLLIKETDRNGLSFYFDYEPSIEGEGYQCVRTRGDGGIYDHKLSYSPGLTIVENSLGHKNSYFHDGSVVTHKIDAMGGESYFEYNQHYELVAETDPINRVTAYKFDERGNKVGVIHPDGSVEQFQFDEEDRIVQIIDQEGGTWQITYDKNGNIVSQIDPLSQQISFEYGENLYPIAIKDHKRNVTHLEYNPYGNLVKFTTPDGAFRQFKYDRLGKGRVLIDENKNVTRRTFDLNGRVIRVDESTGTRKYFDHDPEGNIIRVYTNTSNIKFTYQGMGQVKSKEESGKKVEFIYDTEENLIAINNENGDIYNFEYNAIGDLEMESGYDGIKRFYKRDKAGQIKSVLRASGIESKFEYDLMGRVIKKTNSTGEIDTFQYRGDGALMEASNQNINIYFERDILGRITKEIQGEHEVEYSYDFSGSRTELRSSLGASISYHRNIMGDVSYLEVVGKNQSWQTEFKRNIFGQVISKRTSNGIKDIWEYDSFGRPKNHQIISKDQKVRSRSYVWEQSNQLSQLYDSQNGLSRYFHDKFGNLSIVNHGDGTQETRILDEVGNIFKQVDKKDRKYGSAGKVLSTKNYSLYYDEDGNLAKKIDNKGQVSTYKWNGNGMLQLISMPNGKVIHFSYDALGRRISKSFNGKKVRWVWDGNNPLHEWVENSPQDAKSKIRILSRNEKPIDQEVEPDSYVPAASPIISNSTTWVFEPDSFTPIAKLSNSNFYSISTDYLGSPLEMHSQEGKKIWSSDISIYGNLRQQEGGKGDCPFRFPGQYEDEESGLFYNRFRYYDSELGNYISKDPFIEESFLQMANDKSFSFLGDLKESFDPIFISELCKEYHYVNNTYFFSDPLGLKKCGPRPYKKTRWVDKKGRTQEVHYFRTKKDAKDAASAKGLWSQKPEKHRKGGPHFHDKNHNNRSKPNIHYEFPESQY